MDYKKRTFMFVRKHITVGGLETYIIRTVRKMKEHDCRIIWLAPKGYVVDRSLKKDLYDGKVEIIETDFSDFFWINKLHIVFDKDEKVTALAFIPTEFIFLEMIKRKYKDILINDFFWVPHFADKFVFIEEFAPELLQPVLRKYVGLIIKLMERNNNIIYVNKSHIDAFCRTYGYVVDNQESKLLVGSSREIMPYNAELALQRSKREKFNIITVSRFSFPHKAYILGLIDSYGCLKEKYNQLKLTIIGYGQDENKVIEQIARLSPTAKEDVNLVGKVDYDNLTKYYEEANLNIGVSGTIVEGALTGLISIPVRHYTEYCEGYGYLPESRKHLVSHEPGRPIEEFIEEIINMDPKMYLNLSRASYDTFSNDSRDATENLIKKENINPQKTLPNKYVFPMRVVYFVMNLVRKVRRK